MRTTPILVERMRGWRWKDSCSIDIQMRKCIWKIQNLGPRQRLEDETFGKYATKPLCRKALWALRYPDAKKRYVLTEKTNCEGVGVICNTFTAKGHFNWSFSETYSLKSGHRDTACFEVLRCTNVLNVRTSSTQMYVKYKIVHIEHLRERDIKTVKDTVCWDFLWQHLCKEASNMKIINAGSLGDLTVENGSKGNFKHYQSNLNGVKPGAEMMQRTRTNAPRSVYKTLQHFTWSE